MKRRDILASIAVPLAAQPVLARAAAQPRPAAAVTTGRLKHGMTRGSLGSNKTTEQFCREAAELGVKGVDFILPDEFPILKKYGLICSMYRPIWNEPEPGGKPPAAVPS